MKQAFKFDGMNDPVRPRQRRQIKIQERWDKLTRDSVAAQNAGMTYGQYMARKRPEPGMAEEGDEQRACLHCGKNFEPSFYYRKYCSDACRRMHEMERRRKREKRKEQQA